MVEFSTLLAPRRILAAASRGITPIKTVLAAPATITEGAANVASTINGAATTNGSQQYSPLSAQIEQIGSFELETNTYRDKSLTSDISTGVRRVAKGSGLRFATDAPAFDMCIGAVGTLIVYATDMETGIRARVVANDIAAAVASSRYLKVDFGSAGNRIIEVYTDVTITHRGFNVGANYSIWKAPVADDPRGAVVWDSFGEGVGSSNTNPIKLTVTDFLGESLGIRNLLSLSRAGSGFMRNVTNFGNYTQRIANGDLDISRIGALDFVMLGGSINDKLTNDPTFTDANLQAVVQATVAQVIAKQPNALIIGFGPQVTQTNATAQSRYDAMKAGFLAGAATTEKLIWLDNSASGENWLFGDAGSGNVSRIIGADGTHPNDLGMPYHGRRIGRSMIAAIKAKFSL